MRFIFALLFLFACTKKPDFSAQKQEFYNEANARGCIVAPVEIYFAELEPEIAGYCVPKFGILLNSERWKELGDLQRKELVFHELAHCVFGAEHQQLGLMTPSMNSENELEIMFPRYVDMLFKDCLTFADLMKVTE